MTQRELKELNLVTALDMGLINFFEYFELFRKIKDEEGQE